MHYNVTFKSKQVIASEAGGFFRFSLFFFLALWRGEEFWRGKE
jgi:hypothetical protein